jgi:hypothetical protein
MVKVLPDTEHGPENEVKLTGSPELADADRAIGGTPYVTGVEGGAKLIDCEAGVTVSAVTGELTEG